MRSSHAPYMDEARPAATAPLVFSVQHFCLHDGPGVRSVVFLKGCPLRCTWCQNPESWSTRAELGHKARTCIECRTCVHVCPTGAMRGPGNWSDDACDLCFECVQACPSGALTRFGDARSAAEVFTEVSAEFALFRQSGGGVTFSGGEASLFPHYVLELLEPLREAGIHTAMETCGLFRLHHDAPVDELLGDEARWQAFADQPQWRAVGGVDLLLYDLKLMDDARHRTHCGAPNRHILENFQLLSSLARARRGPAVWARLPLIPDITDDEDNVRAVARFVRDCGLESLTLLPYHNLGVEKLDWLRKPVAFRASLLSEERLERACRIVADEGLQPFEPGEEV
jgi:pyruvate formate lyase activating enzyme